MKREVWSVLGVAAASLFLGACDDGALIVPGSTVHVTLSEWQIVTDRKSAPEGALTVVADNTGADTHDLVLLETDLAANALPVTPAGDVDVTAKGVLVVGSIASIAPGASAQFRLDGASPGGYVFACTVATSNGQSAGHPYAKGMYRDFSITTAPGQE